MGDGGWNTYERLVLAKLEEHSHYHRENAKRLVKLEVEIAQLKVRAGLWGAGASGVAFIIAKLIGG